MRIIKSREDVERLEYNKKIANEGCELCPDCGENKSFRVTKKGRIKGIREMSPHVWMEGFFKIRYMRRDRYYCHTCGCQWESEPYECG